MNKQTQVNIIADELKNAGFAVDDVNANDIAVFVWLKNRNVYKTEVAAALGDLADVVMMRTAGAGVAVYPI